MVRFLLFFLKEEKLIIILFQLTKIRKCKSSNYYQNSKNQKIQNQCMRQISMNSTRPLTRSNNRVVVATISKQNNQEQFLINKVRQNALKNLGRKHCTNENYMVIREINLAILKNQCILKTSVRDIRYDQQKQHMQAYYKIEQSPSQLHELISYYKYYKQKSILFMKDFFALLYRHHQKRKAIQYNRLKILLNLSDSQQPPKTQNDNSNAQESSTLREKSRLGIFRSHATSENELKKPKRCHSSKILDELDLSQLQFTSQRQNTHQQSLLIKKLRNNLSKHIGFTKIKNLSIQQLDRCFTFQKRDQNFNPIGRKIESYFFSHGKLKKINQKTKKNLREQTHSSTQNQWRHQGQILIKNVKRNKSCQNLTKTFQKQSPYKSINFKIHCKKNLSMNNINTCSSTPYKPDQKSNHYKSKKIPVKIPDKQQYLKEKENNLITKCPDSFLEGINDLKNRIREQKIKLMKANLEGKDSKLKREKGSYTTITTVERNSCASINTKIPRFNTKIDEKLKQKTMAINLH